MKFTFSCPNLYADGALIYSDPDTLRLSGWSDMGIAQAILRHMGQDDCDFYPLSSWIYQKRKLCEPFSFTSGQVLRIINGKGAPPSDPGAEVAPELFEAEALRREDEYRAMYDPSYDD